MDPAGSAVGAHLGSAQDRASLIDPHATHPGFAVTANSEGTRTVTAVNQALAYAAWARFPVRCYAATTPSAGEYPYACHELGEVPMVRSTSFIIVVLEPDGQAPPRR